MGQPRVECAPLPETQQPLRVALAAEPVDRGDPFLFHKTTRRRVYDRARLPGFHDTLLWNRAGEITEATTANVVAEVGGRRVTPPVRCGLLAGTFRAELLDRAEVEEGILRREDLGLARRVWLINSVHEWREAIVSSSPD